MRLIEQTYNVLKEISRNPGDGFSGLGLVVYDPDKFDSKSHLDLRPDIDFSPINVYDSRICDCLKEISDYRNKFHDGFHFINGEGTLTHVAQYFVPGIVENLFPDQNHGVRLYSSMCGSTIEGVLFIATICSNGDIYIYRNGEEVNLKELQA